MKKLFTILILVLLDIPSIAQNVNFGAWYLNINTSDPQANKLNPGYFNSDSPPDNFDFLSHTNYTITGQVKVGTGSGISVSGTLYLRLLPSLASTGTYFDIKLADVPTGSTDFQINNTTATWDGVLQNFVASTDFPIIGWLYFEDVSKTFSTHTSDYITLTQRAPLSITAPNASYACGAAPVQLSATLTGGVGPDTFLWSPAAGLSSTSIYNPKASPTSTTTYTVTVTDSGNPIHQTATKNVTVTYVPLIAPAISGSNIFYNPCPGYTASYTYTVTNVPGNATAINWSISGATAGLVKTFNSGTLKTSMTLTGSGPIDGIFTVSCSYSSSCTSNATNLVVTFSNRSCNICTKCIICPTAPGCGTPAVAASTLTEPVIYPNPTSNKTFSVGITVDSEDSYSISILDSYGLTVASKDFGLLGPGSYEESFTMARSGIYYVKVIHSSGVLQSQRVVVN